MRFLRRLFGDRWFVGVGLYTLAYAIGALALTPKGTPLPPDAAEYAEVARSLVSGHGYTVNLTEFHAGLLPSLRHPPELHGLLEPLLMAPFFAAFGAGDALLRVPGVLMLSVLTVLTFACGRRLFGNVAGCLAALLLLGRPSLSVLALLADDDIALAVFSLAAFVCFQRGVSQSERTGWFWAVGLCVGLAILQKFSGIVLPFVFVCVALLEPSFRRSIALRHWVSVFVPAAIAIGAYALRNYAVHGGFGFRFSAIDWLSKDQPFAYFAFYPEAPALSSVFEALGPDRILELIWTQVRALFSVMIEDPILMCGGLVALWPLRKQRAFVLFVLMHWLAMAFVVCVAYHVEPRYLAPLLPFHAIAVAGVLAVVAGRVARALPALPRFGIAGLASLAGLALALIFAGIQRLGKAARVDDPCARAVRFVRDRIGKDEPILTNNPWFVSWKTERPGVMAPTNGHDALITIVQHYGTRWALALSPPIFVADLAAILGEDNATTERLRPERVFVSGNCAIYRFDGS